MKLPDVSPSEFQNIGTGGTEIEHFAGGKETNRLNGGDEWCCEVELETHSSVSRRYRIVVRRCVTECIWGRRLMKIIKHLYTPIKIKPYGN